MNADLFLCFYFFIFFFSLKRYTLFHTHTHKKYGSNDKNHQINMNYVKLIAKKKEKKESSSTSMLIGCRDDPFLK